MIQSIYTSVTNADVVPCGKKGKPISSDPIPLLRNNYLGEYRTELERAKVRKNLGIADNQAIEWGNIDGILESQKDLVNYVESKWLYTNEISEDITNVKQALDYTIHFISNFKSDTESIAQLKKDVIRIDEDIEEVNKTISSTEEALQKLIEGNSEEIESLGKALEETNKAIAQLNEDLKNIDVDANILNWVKESLKGSNTIKIVDDTILEVTLSEEEGNALKLLVEEESETPLPGLYVKDLTPDIQKNTEGIETIQKAQESVQLSIEENSKNITELQKNLESVSSYQTTLSDDTAAPNSVGGIAQGTTVAELKDKTLSQIIDTLLFPTIVRDLIYPQLYYSTSYQLLEVGSNISYPDLIFVQNDAGAELDRQEIFTYNGVEVLGDTYTNLGTYIFSGTVNYGAGSYLVDNKGDTTNKRVEAGSLSTEATVIITYPWYADGNKQQLIPFNQSSGDITISLTGKATIKLPGTNSKLNMFKVVSLGDSYMDVDLSGWTQTTEQLNGTTYKVWTKNDAYSAVLSHKINFTLLS